MDNDKILAINVPNIVSIAIMGTVGVVVIGVVRKLVASAQGS